MSCRRGDLETREQERLAPWASRSRLTRGRRHPEEEHGARTAFQRDRDRIVHSTAFRRLEYKTQVFIQHEGDHYRNRLTHSLETAQIARTLARMLGLNEDLTEAIALAHDLGHPPFGHAGELALDRVMARWGGFEHNRQSLRVVEVIEHRYPRFRGLNLTWETREGLAKHRTAHDSPAGAGDYAPGDLPSLEGQLVDLADEIAYTAHDLDDGVASGLLSLRDLEEDPLWGECWRAAEGADPGAPARLLAAQAVRRLIDALVTECAACTEETIRGLGLREADDARLAPRPAVALGGAVAARFGALKEFLLANLYRHHRVRRMEGKAARVLGELFAAYAAEPALLPPSLRAHLEGHAPERIICDWIAGMTDRYALREHQGLFAFTERI